jgi:Zn2+/Cd2+-exporting ATPase
VHGPDCAHGDGVRVGIEIEDVHVHGHEDAHAHVDVDGHVHGESCGHDHGHDHDHEHGHGHGHGHGQERVEKPAGHRAAEDGGPALQLDLQGLLPEESNEQGRFERFEELLRAHRGVKDAHIRRDAGHAELCIHYDESALPVAELLALARSARAKVAQRYRAKTWFVRGMDSAQCAVVVEHSLNRLRGVLEANVAYASERLVVELDTELTSEREIEARIEALGYALETPEHGHACSHHAHGGGLAPKLELPLSIAGGVLTGTGLLVARGLAGSLPEIVPTVLYALAMASGGYFALRGTFASLKQLRIDIEGLMVLAALGAAALGAWFEGAFLLFLFSVGHAIEHRAMERARRAVEVLAQSRPATAFKKEDGVLRELPVEKLARGDRIVVRPGDRVPVDGVIRDGQSALEQAALTGESVPVDKGPNDEVYCGSINGQGALEVEVLRLSSESMLSKMVDLVSEAESRQGKGQRVARKIEQRAVPWALGLAVLLPVVLIVLGLPAKEALLRALALLVAASPCALAISTPAAVLSAVAAAARNGVLIKGGAYLEALAQVEAVAFDKTGTLTEGKPKLVASLPAEGVSEHELLSLAASLEAHSSHPLAKAVVEGARAKGIALLPAEDCAATHGRGLAGKVQGRMVRLGNLAMFGESPPAEGRALVERLEAEGHTAMLVEADGRLLGALGLFDTPRPEAASILAQLRARGVLRTLLLSGDNRRAAESVAKHVGVDEVHAPLLPQGKVEVLRKLTRTRRGVAMVGDGVNDAPALAAASVGVALGGVGSDAALETADVVLMGDDLNKLPFAIGLAQRAVSVIRQNLFISIGVAAVLIVCSLFGVTGVTESVVFHEGSTLLVVFNGLGLLRFKG